MNTAAGDRGETLIELLVSITIMAVAVPAILGSVLAGVMMSDIHRKQVTASAAVRDYAEWLESYVAAGHYNTAGDYTAAASTGFAAPSGYTASAPVVTCWIPGAGKNNFGSCAADSGIQQVTLSVASGDQRASEKLTVVIRKP